jgi:alkyl hydroperoxide reductase subunit D
MSEHSDTFIESLLAGRASTVARDLKLNLKKLLGDGKLSSEEAYLTLLATATSVEHASLAGHSREVLAHMGLSLEQIEEAAESAAIMAMLNMYYRFRHMVGKDDDYKVAGLRMTSLAKPILGKEKFEMLAFAVSVLNGCESCIRSHEQVLRDAGLEAEKIHDLARLAAVVKGLKTLHTI